MPASGPDGGALPMCSTDSPGPLGDVREGLARVTTIDETDDGVRVTLTNEATFSAIFANQPALATDDEVTVTAAGRGVWLERAGERVGYSIDDDAWFEPGSGIEVPGENLVLELVPTCSGTRAAPMGWSCDTLIDTGYAVRGTNGLIGEGSNAQSPATMVANGSFTSTGCATATSSRSPMEPSARPTSRRASA